MFNRISRAGTGLGIVVVLDALFTIVGIDVPSGSTAYHVTNLLEFAGWIMLIWGQFFRKDLDYGLFRRGDNS